MTTREDQAQKTKKCWEEQQAQTTTQVQMNNN